MESYAESYDPHTISSILSGPHISRLKTLLSDPRVEIPDEAANSLAPLIRHISTNFLIPDKSLGQALRRASLLIPLGMPRSGLGIP